MNFQQKQQYDQNADYVQNNLPPVLSHRTSQFQQLHLKYSYSGMSNASSCSQFILATTRSFNQEFTKPNFVQAQKLYETIIKIVNQLKNTMMIHKDLILYLLYQYKWNEQKLNQFYYDNTEKYWQMSKIVDRNQFEYQLATENQQKNHIFKTSECQTCCMQHLPVIKSYFCDHWYCKSCWSSYIKQNLSRNKIFFSCMDSQCDKGPVLISFVKKVAPQLVQMYRNKICKNYAIINKSVSYCPSDNCTYFCQKSIMIQQNYIQCICGTTYCFKCQKQSHQPATCEQLSLWEKITNHEKNNELWIEKYTRKCPACKQSAEKYIGCNHVKCLCGTQFCFNCLKQWDQIHKNSPDSCVAKKSGQSQIKQQNKQTSQNKISQLSQLTDKIIFISRCTNRDLKMIKQTQQIVSKYQFFSHLKQIFQDLKYKIHISWINFKWCLITLFLKQKPKIQIQLEKDLLQSMRNLVDVVEKIKKKVSTLNLNCLIGTDSKELANLKQELFCKKQAMNKTLCVWMDSWKSLVES